MKRAVMLLLLLCGVLFWPTCVSAEEESVKEDFASLYDSLPEESKQRLEELGVDAETILSGETPCPEEWFSVLAGVLKTESPLPLASFGVLIGIVLLCAATDGFRSSLGQPALSEVYQAVCTVGAGAAMMLPLSNCMARVAETAESVTVFMGSFMPVYVAALVSGGQIGSALSCQTLMLAAAEGVAGVITGVIMPLMAVALALGLTGSVGKGLRIGAIGNWLTKSGAWILATVSSLFVGSLSLRQILAGTTDTVTARAMRLSLSSFVPVVGGALSEALTTLQGSFLLMRSGVGVFGMVAVIAIVLPPLCACVVWSVGLSLCGTMAETLELERLVGMFRTVAGVVKVLIGALAASAMVMIVCTALVLLTGKGA